MKINDKIVNTLNTVSRTVGKHSPLLLTVTGVVGLGATAVFSYKAAKKVEVIVEKVEYSRNSEEEMLALESIHPNDRTEEQEVALFEYQSYFTPVNRMEVAKDLVGAVALPVTTGALSIAAIALSYHVQNNRIVNLAAALATATAEQQFYRAKYKAVHGEEEYNKFMQPTATEKRTIVDSKGKEKEVEATVKSEVPSMHGEWFDKSSEYTRDDHDYNMAYIRSVGENLELRLFRKGFLLMNEVYDALGLERTRAGALLGWSTAGGFNIVPEVTHCLDQETGETLPQIYMKWTTPKYIYDKVEFEAARGSI